MEIPIESGGTGIDVANVDRQPHILNASFSDLDTDVNSTVPFYYWKSTIEEGVEMWDRNTFVNRMRSGTKQTNYELEIRQDSSGNHIKLSGAGWATNSTIGTNGTGDTLLTTYGSGRRLITYNTSDSSRAGICGGMLDIVIGVKYPDKDLTGVSSDSVQHATYHNGPTGPAEGIYREDGNGGWVKGEDNTITI